ncbi:hypothetical protein ACQR35_10100 [Pseudarthrobacter sp. J1738]|uniref:hypothetical protein n=1 Tax=Pseudarthrobacter sp. J1738 TaxID=3420446 RepID=UPI003D2D18B5
MNDVVLSVIFAAIFFYILYGVIRAATRDGIIAARKAAAADSRNERRADHDQPAS